MEYVAEIIIPVKLMGSEFVSGERKLAVSLDCPSYKHSRRTIVYNDSDDKATPLLDIE